MQRFIAYLIFLVAALAGGLASSAEKPVRTVPAVDLQRYLGTWYEIGNYPMFFQRKCVSDTTAVYSANADGSIKVNNSCRTKDGGVDSAEGRATEVKESHGAKLEVSFFRPFKGDYWVIGLDSDYRWAVVGDPARKYLWLLSRTPQLAASDLQLALASARAQGYTLKELRYTPQNSR